MSTEIPDRPALLVAYLERILHGDDAHQGDNPIAKGLRAEAEKAFGTLHDADLAVIKARAAYKDALHTRESSMGAATDAARRTRDAVYSLFGKDHPAVFDYGLSTPTEHRPKGDATQAPKTGDAPKA